MLGDNFAAFILTRSRAGNVATVDTLRRDGYTGPIVLLIDDEDPEGDKYEEIYSSMEGVSVEVFCKREVEGFDVGDNFKDRASVVYARNACFDVAKSLGFTYFIMLDDDYTSWRWRWQNNTYTTKGHTNHLDECFGAVLRYYKATPFTSIAFAQGGDFIGGESCGLISSYARISRKCMNSFFCSTERRFTFDGRINEDVNAYTMHGSRGKLFLTIPHLGLEQVQTQKNSGGMTDIYKYRGTYIKSFYSVMMQPSSVRVAAMGFKELRLHHLIDWGYATPKIVAAKHAKPDEIKPSRPVATYQGKEDTA
mgnify:CR=1 FL=1